MKIAFIPARGGSKGLPRKNVRKFLDEPLVSRAVRIANEAKCFDRVIVNTDDEEIASVAQSAGAEIFYRPGEMGSDVAEVDPLIIWSLNAFDLKNENHLVSLLYCTAPLRTATDIVETVNLVSSGEYTSALTLVETNDYLWTASNESFVPTNYDPKKRAARQQEVWSQFKENKAVYAFWSKDLIESGCRLNGRIGGYIMPSTRSIDIDDEDEFLIAEAIAKVVH